MEDRPLEEAELVARAKRGDLHAYEEIVRRHETIAFRAAGVVAGSAADAEEAAQDAFLKAHAALGRFREGAPFRPWLMQIVMNEARNRHRAAGRRERLTLALAEERPAGDPVRSPEAALLESERRAELLAAVERLGGADRTAAPAATRGIACFESIAWAAPATAAWPCTARPPPPSPPPDAS